jgi:hypothetical protein
MYMGVNAWAVKDKISLNPYPSVPAIAPAQSNYGILIPYTSINASKILAALLSQGIRLRYAVDDFTYRRKSI